MKQPSVYMMANKKNGTLYLGVTSNLIQRIYQHKEEMIAGFTKRYNCKILVWYEQHATMESAITREKALKGSNRNRKIDLIIAQNPEWNDLYESIL